jgi:hypothetical protein
MAWHTLKFRESKLECWFDRYFPTFIIGMIIGVFTLLFSLAIHGCCEKISNEASHKYRLDVQEIHGHSSIYLNEGDFELKDGRISFEKDGTIYCFTNFRLTNISK